MKKIDVIAMKVLGKDRFGLVFPYDKELMKLVRTIPGSLWSRENQCWHIAMTQANLNRVLKDAGKIALINIQSIKPGLSRSGSNSYKLLGSLLPVDREKLLKFNEYMCFRRYSPSTIRTYLLMMDTFLRFRDPDAGDVNLEDEVIRFTNEYILQKRLSWSYQNQFINALRLFYREIEGRAVEVESVKRPRREHPLPNVLSKEEVSKMLRVTRNLKHRTMLSLIYGCGLRRGELLALKPADIDSNRELLLVKMAKGKRDRVVPLPGSLIELLRNYYRDYRPKVWLFEGAKRGEKYDERSLQMVLKKSIYLAGIKKNVTLHWLRHSYATHLHESGVDIHLIQLLLGHKNTRTTEIYTHVSNKSIQRIRSPFDDL
jgi:integrase/recombinase XerD